MAEQNPWKKQLQANKQNFNQTTNNVNTNSPINQWKQNQSSTTNSPSWMKKKQQNQSANIGGNQPAWMKKKQQQNTNTNNNSNQPAWMKKKQEPTSTNVTTGPAWMKKPGQQTNTTSTMNQPATNSPWKTNKFQSPQQKLERQKNQKAQQQRRQKQEQDRRIAQQKQRKQKQLQNQKRQTLQMQKEDTASKEYEAFIKLQNIKKIQQEKNRLQREEQQRRKTQKKSSKKQAKSNTKKQRDQCKSQTIFHKYLHYFNLSVSKVDQYRMKLQSQKDLVQLINQFSLSMTQFIKKLIIDRKIYQKKRKIINLPQTQILYAFCQGKKQKQIIYFDYNEIVRFQKCFQFYSDLQDIIIGLCKKMGNFKIRAPLVVLIKYKGISFLCEALSQELTDLMSSQAKDFKQISNQLTQLQKQLKQYGYMLTKEDLQIKKININDTQHYIIYIKQSQIQKLANNKNEISQLTDHYSLTLRNLQYLINETNLQHFKKMKTPYYNHYVQVAHLAQCINIVYESCQGQVEQTSFWKLVLQKNQQIWTLIRNAGYKGELIKQNILFVYFQCLSGIDFQYRKGMFQNFKVKVKDIKCRLFKYEFNKFQLIQIQGNFQKYLRQNKTQLIQESLKITEQLQRSKEIGNIKNIISLIKRRGKYLISQKKYRPAIEFYNNQIKKLKRYDFSLIELKIELIAILIQKDKQEQVLKTLTSLLQTLDFFYAQETLIHSSLYQMMGTYYSRKEERSKEVIKFFEHSLDIVIKIYGDQKYQVGEIYLSRAAAFINLRKFDLFEKDIHHALKIFKASSKYSAKIAECYFYMGKVKILEKHINEGIQQIDLATNIYMKIQNYVQAINVWLMVLDIVKQDKKYQQIAQKIINTSLTYKNPFYLTKIITKILQKISKEHASQSVFEQILSQKTSHNDEEDSSNALLSLNEIQSLLKNFSNCFEMLRWSFTILNFRKVQTGEYEKARDIIELVAEFYQQKIDSENQAAEQNLQELDNELETNEKNSISQSPQKQRQNQISQTYSQNHNNNEIVQ